MRYRRTERQVYRNIAGEHLLIDTRAKSATPFRALTPTAVPLWQALADWRTEQELVESLRRQFDLEAETATADVREFLGQLETIGALQREES